MFTSNEVSCETFRFFFPFTSIFFNENRIFCSYGDPEISRNKLDGPIAGYWLCDLSISITTEEEVFGFFMNSDCIGQR